MANVITTSENHNQLRKGSIMKKAIFLIILSLLYSNLFANNSIEKQIQALEDSVKQQPENSKYLLQLGRLYHNSGASGNEQDVEKAEKILEKLIELEPQNAQAHCWYGSTITLKARYAKMPFNKMRFVSKGIKEIDKAVAIDSTNISIRMIRANNSLALPAMLNRLDVAVADFEFLLQLAQQNPQYFNNNLLADIHLSLGTAYQKKENIDKAKQHWQKVIELMPDSNSALQANNLIVEVEK